MVKDLPPQAYTREILVQAYDWLQNQPPSVRELARSADEMVSLFKQQQRSRSKPHTDEFKSGLKDLAQSIKKFDEEEETPSALSDSSSLTPSSEYTSPLPSLGSSPYSSPPSSPESSSPFSTQPPPSSYSSPASSSPSEPPSPPSSLLSSDTMDLDEKTKVSLYITRERLNLSSNNEALRVLVVLGLEKIKELFPDKL